MQKINVVLVDDITNEPANETVTFAIDGTTYEIDLTDTHAAELRATMQQWINHARRATKNTRTTNGPTQAKTNRRSDLGQIREWARGNGHQVSDRGRIPATIIDAYDAARQ